VTDHVTADRQRPLSASHRGEGPFLRRFSRLQITLHALVIVSFFGLVLTGVPLHFSNAAWASWMIQLLGGVQSAGFIHRVCAIITFGYFFTHVGTITYRLIKESDRKAILWGPTSMVPQPKDVRDVIQMFAWFLGKGSRPRFDRYSYMEKFDYWGVFWGVAIIGGSGLLLWFPEFFSRFLPGWSFNIATIVHGDEALLALGFIFTVHFFNVHLRPEKFPIDVVIFTGRATADYMKEEHPLEYERVIREGRLEELKASRPSRTLYVWAVGLGFASLALGIGMIVLVLWAVAAG
jgi:cytochrome b subunit of formate dehydrogenase